MNKSDLVKLADQLLSKAGFAPTGTPKKETNKKQLFFERKTLICNPMGNATR